MSINKVIDYNTLSITNIQESELATQKNLETFDYIIINGGDGTIRRVIKILHDLKHSSALILNPIGSFNVIAKLHRVPSLTCVLKALNEGKKPKTNLQNYYRLNNEIFLFSAGNMGDLQHIFLSETLRFGILKHGISKYILAFLFLLPLHVAMTPFMLMSKHKFFIFTPVSFIEKFGSFYGRIEDEITIDLGNGYNTIELDGDIVMIKEPVCTIGKTGYVEIVGK